MDLLSRLGSRIEDELGSLPEGLRAVIEGAVESTPRPIVTDRSALEAVPTTGTLESMLERGLASLLGRVPTGWLAREEEKGGHRLTLADLGAPFSLLSNIRAGRGTGQHPFARALLQARDFADDRVDRDVFASALSVAEIARLGELLPVLHGVPGSDERVRQLWGKDRPRAMNTLYELVVAGALAEFGRDVEFVPETDRKTPDLRVHDATGVSTFVECKRKRGLTRAEIAEERAVRELFDVLAGRADRPFCRIGTETRGKGSAGLRPT
ncbi:MAG TPA: hypothetical protein EYQ24_09595 [Bacteroidetes bacterium]|nr:hypothetical protein [Bacteroidota bacterium]